jgi:hypothetical protein
LFCLALYAKCIVLLLLLLLLLLLCLWLCRFVCSKRDCPALLSSPTRGRRATLTPLLLLQVCGCGAGGRWYGCQSHACVCMGSVCRRATPPPLVSGWRR